MPSALISFRNGTTKHRNPTGTWDSVYARKAYWVEFMKNGRLYQKRAFGSPLFANKLMWIILGQFNFCRLDTLKRKKEDRAFCISPHRVSEGPRVARTEIQIHSSWYVFLSREIKWHLSCEWTEPDAQNVQSATSQLREMKRWRVILRLTVIKIVGSACLQSQ